MKKVALVFNSCGGKQQHIWEIMPPLWALSLASYLRAAAPGVRVDILDEQVMSPAKFLKTLSEERYDVAGFSPIFSTYPEVLAQARLFKKNGAVVVLGGHHAPALKREILANRGPGSDDYCVDAIVQGDGEKALLALVKGKAFSGIKNLIYLRGDGSLAENPAETLSFSELPPVDYSLVDLEDYFRRQLPFSRRVVPFVSQRGCKWADTAGRCVFCCIRDKGLRAMAPGEVWKQASYLYKKLGVKYLYEAGDDFAADAAWLRELAAGAPGRSGPAWWTFARPASLTPDTVKSLKKVNVGYAILGVESFSDAMLASLGKGASVSVNKRAIALLNKAGIVPRFNIILGAPGESEATLAETFAELKTLELVPESWRRLYLTTLSIYPGTKAWADLLEKEKKYAGLDLFKRTPLFNDWLRHFCGLKPSRLLSVKKEMEAYITSRAAAR